jgi:DNA-binding response OmpR family regulator
MTARKGAKLAVGEEYDVIVLDLNLPRRDGISLLRELREKKKKSSVWS